MTDKLGDDFISAFMHQIKEMKLKEQHNYYGNERTPHVVEEERKNGVYGEQLRYMDVREFYEAENKNKDEIYPLTIKLIENLKLTLDKYNIYPRKCEKCDKTIVSLTAWKSHIESNRHRDPHYIYLGNERF